MAQLTEAPDGLELIRAIFDGCLPPPGVATLLGMTGASADRGRVTFTLDPRREHGNPMGTIHGGVLATMLDSAMTCAVHTMLPAGSRPTTLELSVRFHKPVLPDGPALEATGTAIQVGGRVGTAEGRITGPDGTLYATGSTSCLILGDAS